MIIKGGDTVTQLEWREQFSKRLVDILRTQNVNQSKLARDSGLSASRISDYINKRAAPTIFAVINISYALNVSVSDLIDFDERIVDRDNERKERKVWI